jgi:hypothetical protein
MTENLRGTFREGFEVAVGFDDFGEGEGAVDDGVVLAALDATALKQVPGT